jgi:membrane protein
MPGLTSHESPSGIPVPGGGRIGWLALGRALYREYQKDAVSDSAATLSYFFFFSFFPFLVFLATMTAYLPFVQSSVTHVLAEGRAILPAEVMSVIDTHVQGLIGKPRPKLLTIGILVTLYSASRGIDATRKALNLAYDVKETRPLWKTEAMNFGLTLGGALLLLVGVAGVVAGGDAGFWLARHLQIGDVYVVAWQWARWPVTAFLVMSLAALTYYVLPDVQQEFRFITPGAVIGTLLSLGSTWGFTKYVSNFGSYNITYGSLGGVIMLMTWFYITGLIYVMGGEVNAILEHHSEAGKTKGAHAVGETPPPPSARPSAASPGDAKSSSLQAASPP